MCSLAQMDKWINKNLFCFPRAIFMGCFPFFLTGIHVALRVMWSDTEGGEKKKKKSDLKKYGHRL